MFLGEVAPASSPLSLSTFLMTSYLSRNPLLSLALTYLAWNALALGGVVLLVFAVYAWTEGQALLAALMVLGGVVVTAGGFVRCIQVLLLLGAEGATQLTALKKRLPFR